MALRPFKESSILIATPHMDRFSPKFIFDHLTTEKPESVDMHWTGFTYLDDARNEAVQHLFETQHEYLFFVDSDQGEIPPDGLRRLYELDVDIAGGLYHMRRKPYSPVAYHRNPPNLNKKNGNPTFRSIEEEATKPGPLEVDVVGTGFMLIKRWLLDAFWNTEHADLYRHAHHRHPLKDLSMNCICSRCARVEGCPSYELHHLYAGDVAPGCDNYSCRDIKPFRLGLGYGEDTWFCKTAKELFDAKIVVHRDVLVGHLTEVAIVGKEIVSTEAGKVALPRVLPLN